MPPKDAPASYCFCLRLIGIIKTPHRTGNLRINVTLGRVCATIVAVEKLIRIAYSEFVSVAVVIQHAMRLRHIFMWPAQLYSIFFSHYLINPTILEKNIKFLNMRCLLWFSLQRFVPYISHSKKKWARCDQKCILVSMESTRYSCPVLMKVEFFRQIFE